MTKPNYLKAAAALATAIPFLIEGRLWRAVSDIQAALSYLNIDSLSVDESASAFEDRD
jgi:hypothetical protein